jgi:DNA-binding cell septation regulator SpoVG
MHRAGMILQMENSKFTPNPNETTAQERKLAHPISREIENRLQSIVKALARQAARQHYAEACLRAKKDSESNH